MSDIHWANDEKNQARKVLENILEIYPDNNAISFQLIKHNIKDSINLVVSVKNLKEL